MIVYPGKTSDSTLCRPGFEESHLSIRRLSSNPYLPDSYTDVNVTSSTLSRPVSLKAGHSSFPHTDDKRRRASSALTLPLDLPNLGSLQFESMLPFVSSADRARRLSLSSRLSMTNRTDDRMSMRKISVGGDEEAVDCFDASVADHPGDLWSDPVPDLDWQKSQRHLGIQPIGPNAAAMRSDVLPASQLPKPAAPSDMPPVNTPYDVHASRLSFTAKARPFSDRTTTLDSVDSYATVGSHSSFGDAAEFEWGGLFRGWQGLASKDMHLHLNEPSQQVSPTQVFERSQDSEGDPAIHSSALALGASADRAGLAVARAPHVHVPASRPASRQIDGNPPSESAADTHTSNHQPLSYPQLSYIKPERSRSLILKRQPSSKPPTGVNFALAPALGMGIAVGLGAGGRVIEQRTPDDAVPRVL